MFLDSGPFNTPQSRLCVCVHVRDFKNDLDRNQVEEVIFILHLHAFECKLRKKKNKEEPGEDLESFSRGSLNVVWRLQLGLCSTSLQVVELQEGLVQNLVHVQVLLFGLSQFLWRWKNVTGEFYQNQRHKRINWKHLSFLPFVFTSCSRRGRSYAAPHLQVNYFFRAEATVG